jgi:hypothetical protein
MEFTENEKKCIRYLATMFESRRSPTNEGIAQACGISTQEATPLYAAMRELGFIEIPRAPEGGKFPSLYATAPKATYLAVQAARDLDRRPDLVAELSERARRHPMLGFLIFASIALLGIVAGVNQFLELISRFASKGTP